MADPCSFTDCPACSNESSNEVLQVLAMPVAPDTYGYREAACRAVKET